MKEEVYKTKGAAIQQCDRNELFYLVFGSEELPFKLCDLLAFKKRIEAIDLMTLLDTGSPDHEIIHLKHCDRFLILDTFQILEFRELLHGTFVTLALNSSVQKILRVF
jgi:hypothetical protein